MTHIVCMSLLRPHIALFPPTFYSLHLIRDTSKEKPLELEMGWLCAESGFKHSHVPKDLVSAADQAGKTALEGGATLAYAVAQEEAEAARLAAERDARSAALAEQSGIEEKVDMEIEE
jgi:hypothetical protein